MESTLDKLDINKSARVILVTNIGEMKDRFLDIGLTTNTLIKCVLSGNKKEINGYEIRGAVIAIRKEDAEKVKVSVIGWRETFYRPPFFVHRTVNEKCLTKNVSNV